MADGSIFFFFFEYTNSSNFALRLLEQESQKRAWQGEKLNLRMALQDNLVKNFFEKITSQAIIRCLLLIEVGTFLQFSLQFPQILSD